MGSKEREIDCLNRVFLYKNQSRGKVKKFIHHLSLLNREDAERPDFIFTGYGVRIGLEHFMVDHLSQKNKNGKIASNGVVGRQALDNVIQKCKNSIDLSDANIMTLIGEFYNIACRQVERALNTTYRNFLESFKSSLNTHLSKCRAYKSKLKYQFNGKTYLGLLIEIHAEFGYLFLNNNRGTKRIEFGYVPIFYDVVEIIKKSCKGNVDFVILCTGESIYKNSNKVYIASINNIEKDLENQKVKIYRYIAEDFYLNSFQPMQTDVSIEPKICYSSDNFDISFDMTSCKMSDDDTLDLLYTAFYYACIAKAKHYDFACSASILYLLNIYAEYVLKWEFSKNEQGECKVKPIFYPIPSDILNKKIEAFEKNGNFVRMSKMMLTLFHSHKTIDTVRYM